MLQPPRPMGDEEQAAYSESEAIRARAEQAAESEGRFETTLEDVGIASGDLDAAKEKFDPIISEAILILVSEGLRLISRLSDEQDQAVNDFYENFLSENELQIRQTMGDELMQSLKDGQITDQEFKQEVAERLSEDLARLEAGLRAEPTVTDAFSNNPQLLEDMIAFLKKRLTSTVERLLLSFIE